MRISEELHERLVKVANELSEVADEMSELYNEAIPEEVSDDMPNSDTMYDNLDDALYNVRVADEQFDRVYAILSGEWDDVGNDETDSQED